MQDIHELKRQGLSVSAINALTGFDRKTVRKYLEAPSQAPQYGPRAPRPRKLDPFRPYLTERLRAGVWNAQVLLELRERRYTGGYTLLKDHLQPLRQAAKTVAVRRFETPPGQQAQMDWGHLGYVEGPEGRQTLYRFVLTLGHSRAHYADLATDQTLGTLLRLHEAAFHALGGVSHGTVFRDFARFWGFTPRVCRAYRPQTKGKVESGIRCLRVSLLCGRTGSGVADLRGQFVRWTAEVALPRVHGTTHRQGCAQRSRSTRSATPGARRCHPAHRRLVLRGHFLPPPPAEPHGAKRCEEAVRNAGTGGRLFGSRVQVSGGARRPGWNGEGGIRTRGRVTPTPVFETGSFNHSDTSPRWPLRAGLMLARAPSAGQLRA